MMFLIVGCDSVRSDHHAIVTLIGVERRHPNARMSIDPCDHNAVWFQRREHVIQARAEKRTVTLFDDHGIVNVVIEFGQNLAALRPGNRDASPVIAHGEKGIAQVRREFLPDPDNGPLATAKQGDKRVDGTNQIAASFSQRS